MIENILIERYLLQAVSTIDGAVLKDHDLNFKCNVCGDSKSRTSLKRGHLKYHNGDSPFWYYKCFNGECPAFETAWPAEKWLKQFYPTLYKLFIRELVREKNNSNIDYAKKVHKKVQSFEEQRNRERKRKEKSDEKESVKYFYNIGKSDLPLFEQARNYCIKRKIPENIWKKFFVCTEGMYKNRLIIPFYDNNNKIYYFQGRSLDGKEPKYLNRKTSKDNCIYNIFNVDKSKPVVVFEGPIDSMMVENSIATLGLGISKDMQAELDSMNCYYLLDDDPDGNKMASKFLSKGKTVFLWSKFKKDFKLPQRKKWDMNDTYIFLNRKNQFTVHELRTYFTNSLFDKIYI